jgi:hypothetical protein
VTATAHLKHNIDTLLKARNQTRHDLAFWCRKSDAWLSKILSETAIHDQKRGVPLKYLDRIADFFGISPYQLFQPGISALTERRKAPERRSGQDRRIGRSRSAQQVVNAPIAPTLTADEVFLLRRLRQLKFEQWQHVSAWIDATLLSQGIAPDTATPRGRRRTKPVTTETGLPGRAGAKASHR